MNEDEARNFNARQALRDLKEDLLTTIAEFESWDKREDELPVLVARELRYSRFHLKQIIGRIDRELDGNRS